MKEQFVAGITIERRLREYFNYSEEDIRQLKNIPTIGPEAGNEVNYDFYHQHDLHSGTGKEYFTAFIPDEEMNFKWVAAPGTFWEYVKALPFIKEWITRPFLTMRTKRLNFYGYDSRKQSFASTDYKRTITLWNRDNRALLNDTVEMEDIVSFAMNYFRVYAEDFGVGHDGTPKKAINMFLSLFSPNGAVMAGAYGTAWYRGGLLEALKRIYIYTCHATAPFDSKTVLFAMRIVQEVAMGGYPMYTPGRPVNTYDVDMDDFLFYDVYYPNPDGSLNAIYRRNGNVTSKKPAEISGRIPSHVYINACSQYGDIAASAIASPIHLRPGISAMDRYTKAIKEISEFKMRDCEVNRWEHPSENCYIVYLTNGSRVKMDSEEFYNLFFCSDAGRRRAFRKKHNALNESERRLEERGLGDDYDKTCAYYESIGYEIREPDRAYSWERGFVGESYIDLNNGRVIVIFPHGVTKEMNKDEAWSFRQ